MNRASFLRRLVTTAAGLYVADDVLELLTHRKVWAGHSFGHVLYGDGVHDDSPGLQAFINGEDVLWPDGSLVGDVLYNRAFRLTRTITSNRTTGPQRIISGCYFPTLGNEVGIRFS